MNSVNGAQIILEVLKRHDATTVFGHPGGSALPLYDALGQDEAFTHYLVRHEQGAVHMAEGYARSTGRVGVVFVTSGPGATNTVTGLADAKMDSIPVLVISAQVSTGLIGRDGFQEADVVGITLPATKHSDLVQRVEDLEGALHDAFRIILEGRPGPVLLDVPKDILLGSAPYPTVGTPPTPGVFAPGGDFEDAARALCEAKRPIIYSGGGVINADAHRELTDLAHLLRAPVTNTLMGLGGFPGSDDQFVGMLGMHGTYTANMAIHESDCILAAGARFDDRVTGKLDEFAPHASIIHLDIDAAEIGKNVRVHWPLVADAREGLARLAREVRAYLGEGHSGRVDALDEWWQSLRQWQELHPLRYDTREGMIMPQALVQEIRRQAAPDAIIATDVGQHQMWAAQYLSFDRPRKWITSGGLGTMGYGLPAAIGAQIGNPGTQVIALVGDGSFQMTMQEMALLMHEDVPLKLAIFNNHFLGLVRQWQDLFYEQRFVATDLSHSPDYVKVADAYGVPAARVEDPDDLKDGVRTMLEHDGAYVLEVDVDHEEHVYPIVPAGAASKDMLLFLE